MTKSILIGSLVAGALVLGLSGPAYAGSCPRLSKQVDAGLATSSLSADKKAEIMTLRMKGDALHGSGSHGESVATLKKALSMLAK